jgi:hypothetical protein
MASSPCRIRILDDVRAAHLTLEASQASRSSIAGLHATPLTPSSHHAASYRRAAKRTPVAAIALHADFLVLSRRPSRLGQVFRLATVWHPLFGIYQTSILYTLHTGLCLVWQVFVVCGRYFCCLYPACYPTCGSSRAALYFGRQHDA